MRYFIVLISLFLPTQCMAEEYPPIDAQDAQEILSVLLGVRMAQYQSENADGEKVYNPLKAYHGWGDIYQKYYTDAKTHGRLNDIKVYLFLAYTARLKNQIDSSEVFSTDLYTVYIKHEKTLLAALKKNPYLIPSTCYYLGNYFGFESKHSEDKPGFLAAHRKTLLDTLGEKHAETCLMQIKQPTHSNNAAE